MLKSQANPAEPVIDTGGNILAMTLNLSCICPDVRALLENVIRLGLSERMDTIRWS
jgi:hypothetical protein